MLATGNEAVHLCWLPGRTGGCFRAIRQSPGALIEVVQPGRERWFFAETLARNGYTGLTMDFRGYCPGGRAGCSEDGSTADGWKDLLGGVRYLRRHGVTKVVLIGSSMGATASVVAAAQHPAGVAGVIALSGPVMCCGLRTNTSLVRSIRMPILFVVGRRDAGLVRATRTWGRWAGSSAQTVILPSGEHGLDLLHFATPPVRRRATSLVLDFMMHLS